MTQITVPAGTFVVVNSDYKMHPTAPDAAFRPGQLMICVTREPYEYSTEKQDGIPYNSVKTQTYRRPSGVVCQMEDLDVCDPDVLDAYLADKAANAVEAERLAQELVDRQAAERDAKKANAAEEAEAKAAEDARLAAEAEKAAAEAQKLADEELAKAEAHAKQKAADEAKQADREAEAAAKAAGNDDEQSPPQDGEGESGSDNSGEKVEDTDGNS